MNDYETCPEKIKHLNTSDWSIFHRRPERDHLVQQECPPIQVKYSSAFKLGYVNSSKSNDLRKYKFT